MKKIAHALMLTLLALAPLACDSEAVPAAPATKGASGALRVRVADAATRDVIYRVRALGSLEADERVQVTAEVSGAVEQVLFHEGDSVTPRTVLTRIDPERYRLEADRAGAAFRRSLADSNRAHSDLERREALALDQLVAVEELNRARQESERLSADAEAAKAALDIALQNVDRSEVRPPRAGTIDTRSVNTGEFVQPGKVLATLVDLRKLRLRFKVSEGESLAVGDGQAVAFRVSAVGDREYTARIYHIGEVADPATRQVEVLGWVENPGELKPGFFAEVDLEIDAHLGAVVVPESAVQASERGFVVYTVTDGRAHARQVQIGLRSGDGSVEILSGLSSGETVVVEGSDRLADGIAVSPVAPIDREQPPQDAATQP